MKIWNDGLQDVLLRCGKTGCLFLCYLNIASESGTKIDFLDALDLCIKGGLIDYDFTVKDAEKLLHTITGHKWIVTKKDPDYKPEDNEYVIKGYGLDKTVGHWDMDKFHPMTDSNNVKNGHVISLRVCRMV